MPATTLTDVTELRPLNTRKQTAVWCGCSDKQIDLLVNAGKFPKPVRVGTHPRWRRSDLLAWLDQQSSQPSEDAQS